MESYEKWVEAKQFEAYKESQKEFYRSVSKQFEVQNPKPYQKRKVNGQMKFDDVDDAYRRAIQSEKESYSKRYKEHKKMNHEWQQKTEVLSEAEAELLFWNMLIHLGWQRFTDDKDVKSFVYPCYECDKVLVSIYYQFLDAHRIKSITNEGFLAKARQDHQCEAIPKAIPKA